MLETGIEPARFYPHEPAPIFHLCCLLINKVIGAVMTPLLRLISYFNEGHG